MRNRAFWIGGVVAPLLAWALIAAQAVSRPATPANPGFEQVAGSAPSGWLVMKANGQDSYRLESVAGLHGKGVRLSLAVVPDPAGSQYDALYQEIDARPYRGKHVRFRASLKVSKPGLAVGLGMRVQRPQPKFAGFSDMQADPIAPGGWVSHQITGRVAADAEWILIAINVRGDADVAIDDVSFEVVPRDPAPPSPQAKAYLDAAIAILRERHIDSAHADWPRIIADANEDIGGAKVPRDVYPAIRGILGALGEKHSFLVAAPRAATASATGAPPTGALPMFDAPPMPGSELVEGRFGVVRLPRLGALGPGADETSVRYIRTLRIALEMMDKAPLCGWIVDLRGNSGGNMWPMLRGIDPLLGSAPFGTFIDPKGVVQLWQRKGGGLFPSVGAAPAEPPSFALAHADAPLAVLIGPETGSSGEMTAVALIGRAGVRVFGAMSAGYTTGNSAIPLSDGATLVVTGVFIRDRAGKPYDGPITPDVTTLPGTAQAEAVRWLGAQCKAE